MLNKETKVKLINTHKKHATDSGSSEVQIVLLTARINQVSEHLKKFPKDYHSQLGLVKLVGQRRSLMKYLKRKDNSGYNKLMQSMNA